MHQIISRVVNNCRQVESSATYEGLWLINTSDVSHRSMNNCKQAMKLVLHLVLFL